MISLEKLMILTPLQKLLPKALKSCPKSNKSPNLVTLPTTNVFTVHFSVSDWSTKSRER